MLHNCRFNKEGICHVCGRVKGLTLEESREYNNPKYGDCFQGSEATWWNLHHKVLRAKKRTH